LDSGRSREVSEEIKNLQCLSPTELISEYLKLSEKAEKLEREIEHLNSHLKAGHIQFSERLKSAEDALFEISKYILPGAACRELAKAHFEKWGKD